MIIFFFFFFFQAEDGIRDGTVTGVQTCALPISAQAQHKELVAAYEHFGVRVHWHEPEPELPMQVYSRDSSVMTPYGAIITAMANWWRRGENYAAIRTYERLGIPVYDMVTAGTFEGGDF